MRPADALRHDRDRYPGEQATHEAEYERARARRGQFLFHMCSMRRPTPSANEHGTREGEGSVTVPARPFPCAPDNAAVDYPHAALHRPLLRWYDSCGRHDLPWRCRRDPYAVLVSEVMLQQTQVARVLPHYERWLARWPAAPALAAEPLAEVVRAWAGLGYNRRAVYLHSAAALAVQRHRGQVPGEPALLRRLPGVGEYTANAVACFAAEAPLAVVETNIARVLARAILGVASSRDAAAAILQRAAAELLPPRHARAHNLALMDLGALLCRPKEPACGECPLAPRCAWLAQGRPEGRPTSAPAPRFATTSRYARGRIVEALRRSGQLREEELTALLPGPHAARTPTYLVALERDGLVVRLDGGWSLPGDQGSSSIASPKL